MRILLNGIICIVVYYIAVFFYFKTSAHLEPPNEDNFEHWNRIADETLAVLFGLAILIVLLDVFITQNIWILQFLGWRKP